MHLMAVNPNDPSAAGTPHARPAGTVPRARDNFFQLKEEEKARAWGSQEEFQTQVITSREVTNAIYRPDGLVKDGLFRSIDDRVFVNLSFSKTKIEGSPLSNAFLKIAYSSIRILSNVNSITAIS